MSTHPSNKARFDVVADVFGGRAGLPVEACVAAAERVVELADLRPGELLLDVGAGTGDVGLELARRCPGYFGIDLSTEMLEKFRARAGGELAPRLEVADAGGRWPVADRSCRVVFGSRSLHLLDADHVLAETRRVAGPRGALLIIGTVDRDRGSIRDRMRRRMREALDAEGIEGRSGHKGRLRRALGAAGFDVERHVVAEWKTEFTAQRALDGWERLDGLDNVDLPAETKARVLDAVRARTIEAEGTLDRPEEGTERYVLELALSPPATSR